MTRCLTRLLDPPQQLFFWGGGGLDPRSRLWEPRNETIMATWLGSRTRLRCLEVSGVFISSSSSSLLEVDLIIVGSPPPSCCFSGQTGASRKPRRLYRDSGDGMMTARIRFKRSLLLQQNRLKTPSKIKQFDSKC